MPDPSCNRRKQSASWCTRASGHTIVYDRPPPARTIHWTRSSPMTIPERICSPLHLVDAKEDNVEHWTAFASGHC